MGNTNNFAGFGIGLRSNHYQTLLSEKPAIDWLEAVSEDYMVEGGEPLNMLGKICQYYPVALHGVSLSIGSCDPLNRAYLKQLKTLIKCFNPLWVSDHFCWTGVDGVNTHDLLPLPHTEEALKHLVPRIQQVQDLLGQRILLENISSYVSYENSEMSEAEFIREAAQRADCAILLDVNNVYVNSVNHGFDPLDYFASLPQERVQQMHLAGYKKCQTHLLDTHGSPVDETVWQLYQQAIGCFGLVPTNIERDNDIPPLGEMLVEMRYARKLAFEVVEHQALV